MTTSLISVPDYGDEQGLNLVLRHDGEVVPGSVDTE